MCKRFVGKTLEEGLTPVVESGEGGAEVDPGPGQFLAGPRGVLQPLLHIVQVPCLEGGRLSYCVASSLGLRVVSTAGPR